MRATWLGVIGAAGVLALAACEPPGDRGEGVSTIEAELVAQGDEGLEAVAPVELADPALLTEPAPGAPALEGRDLLDHVRWLVSQERYPEARELLQAQVEAQPQDVTTTLVLAGVDLLDESYRSAYDLSDAALAVAPGDVRLMQTRALASLLDLDVATALEDYKELVSAMKRLAEAEGATVCQPISQCCATAPEALADALIGLATAHYNLGDLDAATDLADTVFGMRGINPVGAHFVMALVQSKRGDDAAALASYQTILQTHPGNPLVLNNVGGIAYRAKDLDGAERLFVATVENAGVDRRTAAIAWSNLGDVALLRGDYKAAEDKLLEATSISPGFPGAWFNLAVVYDLLGDDVRSKAHLVEGLNRDEQGVSRYNSSHFSPEWEAHFEGLLAEHDGRVGDAVNHWQAVAAGNVPALHATAARHLARLTPVGVEAPAGLVSPVTGRIYIY